MLEGGKHPQPHHHGDDGEEVPVALDSGEAERKHVGEENHGWTEADSTQDLRERREKDSRTQWTGVWKCYDHKIIMWNWKHGPQR